MSAPTLTPAPRPVHRTGSHCAARTGHRATVPTRLPGIGVGTTPQVFPSVPATTLSRYRVREDRPSLNLRAGELVLCAVYEPAALGMIILVRCESDGYAPGALMAARELELIERTEMRAELVAWSVPGVRG